MLKSTAEEFGLTQEVFAGFQEMASTLSPTSANIQWVFQMVLRGYYSRVVVHASANSLG